MDELQELRARNALLHAVTRAQSLYFRDADPTVLFDTILGDLLALTDSTFGYIAEVLDDDGAPYLRTWAITDISWSPETQAMYEQQTGEGGGLEFRNLDTLFGWGLREGGRVVIANEPADDFRAGGLPEGHPPLDAFLAVPVFRGDELVGQLGVSNREGGYDQELVEFLQPFVLSVGNLIDAYRTDRERRQAEADRISLQRRHSAILDHISDVITVLDPDGGWVSSSPAGTRLLGYPPGFDPPGGILSLLHPDDVAVAEEAFEQVAAWSRGPFDPVDLRVRAVDGDYRVFETFGDDLRHDPAVRGILLTSRDVTDRRRAERALVERTAELTTLLDNLTEAVLFVDADRHVLFVNQLFCDLLQPGSTPEQLIGRQTPSMLEESTALVADDDFRARVAHLYATERAQFGDLVTLRDGRVLERDYLPIHSELGVAYLWIYRDMTERARVDEQRRLAVVHERAMRLAIEEQNQALRELDELKDQFVAMVSHELRTPLTSIISFSELLADGAEVLDVEQRGFLDVIRRNGTRLLDLVGDLLLIAQLETGSLELELEEVTLARVVDGVVEAFHGLASARGIELAVDTAADDTPILIDPGRFDQVVMNLVSNAVKFTPDGGSVQVITRRDGPAWVLEVVDTGIGVPESEADRLFERFFRGTNARLRQLPGTGLGLAITRAIVELHGGRIEVQSSAAGTRVVVAIPDRSSARRGDLVAHGGERR